MPCCQSIAMLDLKFILHHGEFIIQDIGGTPELAGTDVNLVHRLLKNLVAEKTGWRAYALFTQAALDGMHMQPEGLVESFESYEHLGETCVLAVDLHVCYESLIETQHIFVSPAEADRVLYYDYVVPLPIVWEWFNDPAKQGQWSTAKFAPFYALAPG